MSALIGSRVHYHSGMETIPQFNFDQTLQGDSIFDYRIIHQCITSMACFSALQVETMGTCGNNPILCPISASRGETRYTKTRPGHYVPANASICVIHDSP
jgi:hypothetical protein